MHINKQPVYIGLITMGLISGQFGIAHAGPAGLPDLAQANADGDNLPVGLQGIHAEDPAGSMTGTDMLPWPESQPPQPVAQEEPVVKSVTTEDGITWWEYPGPGSQAPAPEQPPKPRPALPAPQSSVPAQTPYPDDSMPWWEFDSDDVPEEVQALDAEPVYEPSPEPTPTAVAQSEPEITVEQRLAELTQRRVAGELSGDEYLAERHRIIYGH